MSPDTHVSKLADEQPFVPLEYVSQAGVHACAQVCLQAGRVGGGCRCAVRCG